MILLLVCVPPLGLSRGQRCSRRQARRCLRVCRHYFPRRGRNYSSFLRCWTATRRDATRMGNTAAATAAAIANKVSRRCPRRDRPVLCLCPFHPCPHLCLRLCPLLLARLGLLTPVLPCQLPTSSKPRHLRPPGRRCIVSDSPVVIKRWLLAPAARSCVCYAG